MTVEASIATLLQTQADIQAIYNLEFQPWIVKTAAYTATNKNRILADTTVAAFTITLPATPVQGWSVTIADAGGTFDLRALTVAGNGANIMGSAASVALVVKNVATTFVYHNPTRGWVIGK